MISQIKFIATRNTELPCLLGEYLGSASGINSNRVSAITTDNNDRWSAGSSLRSCWYPKRLKTTARMAGVGLRTWTYRSSASSTMAQISNTIVLNVTEKACTDLCRVDCQKCTKTVVRSEAVAYRAQRSQIRKGTKIAATPISSPTAC
jgi:hypothetical protein